MKNELYELFQLAAKFFIKRYKKKGGAQSKLADELGITQSYLSSVVNGSRSASLELYSQIAEKLYGPLDKFLAVGRRIKEGHEPFAEKDKAPEDPVEKLIARLTYYVVDHQRIENELSELKLFYETIVENQQIGVLVMNKDHSVIYANRYMKIMADIPADLIIGSTPYNIEDKIPGLDISNFRNKYNEGFEQRQLINYTNIQTKKPNGDIIFISGSIIPLFKNNAFESMICTILDTTSSHILRNLMAQTIDFCSHGIGVVKQVSPSPHPKTYFMNKRFREIFGIQDIDPAQVSFAETNKRMAAGMKNGKKWLAHIKKALASDTYDVETTISMKNNRNYKWVSNPLIDDGGNHWGRIVVVEEIKQETKKKNTC